MPTGLKHLQYRRLRAPREDRGVLMIPPLAEVAPLVAANLKRSGETDYDFQGRCFSDVAREARGQLIREALRWTSAYRDVDLGRIDPTGPIFLAGHQPQLFHSGVWLKNFALAGLAAQHGAVAVNLLIDSDTIKSHMVPVPGGSVTRPEVAAIPLDAPGPQIPFEERQILDRGVFADFGDRVAGQIAPLVADPLVGDYWPRAIHRSRRTSNLGACLAQSRHQLEGGWGITSLEIPQSWVCSMTPYRWFMAHLLAQLPRFREVYNEVVREYRGAHRIRSTAHPVPDLAREGQWLEAPFWIWTVDDPRRRRLFVRRQRDALALSDRSAVRVDLPLTPEGDAGRAVQRLAELARGGLKIRCRALITTLWARLVLGDLFLHGIGGAKYDQLTDALIARFFGLEPPDFLVLSATLQLPIARQRTTAEEARTIEQRLRALTYHPECYANGASEDGSGGCQDLAELVTAKARWIRTEQTPENARTRWREIRRINEALQPCVAIGRQRLLEERGRVAAALKAEGVLSSREYGFCLFPEKTLRNFFFRLLPKKA